MSEKDYHDVLGVRPNAGLDEIELAYKGRRSQYHPDRYGQSDEDTRAWATSKMQDVNEAYAALKNKEEHARLGLSRHRRAPDPTPPTQTAKNLHSATLQQILKRSRPTGEPFEKIHVAPNIPLKKLHGAIESYGGGVQPKDVVALIDDTVFGGAKEGMLFTETEVRSKAIFQPPQQWEMERIERVAFEGNRVFIDGREIAQLNIPDKREAQAFFTLFDSYLKQRGPHTGALRSSGERQGETVASHSGEPLPFGQRGAFYAQMEKAVQRELGSAKSKEEWLTLAIVSRLLPLSLALEHSAQNHGTTLSSTQRAFLASDMLRFDLLIYSMSATGYLLSTEAGLDEDQISEVVAPVAFRMLLPYVVEVEGLDSRRTLRSLADPTAELQTTQVFLEFSRRWRRYALLLSGADGDLAQEFRQSLKTPAASVTQNVASMVTLQKFAGEVIDSVLPEESTPAFLGAMAHDVEGALVSIFEQA